MINELFSLGQRQERYQVIKRKKTSNNNYYCCFFTLFKSFTDYQETTLRAQGTLAIMEGNHGYLTKIKDNYKKTTQLELNKGDLKQEDNWKAQDGDDEKCRTRL